MQQYNVIIYGRLKKKNYMLFGTKMVLCALAGLSASLRSAAKLPAAAHKTPFLLHNIIYYFLNYEDN
jgi:hypothetical protein